MSQDGLAAFEPAFVDELSVMISWAFDYMQRDKNSSLDDQSTGWSRDANGGSVYLRLTTKPIDQPSRSMTPALAANIIKGGYWLRPPGPNCELVIAYQGLWPMKLSPRLACLANIGEILACWQLLRLTG